MEKWCVGVVKAYCNQCNKKVLTAASLSMHMLQFHTEIDGKLTNSKKWNDMPGKDQEKELKMTMSYLGESKFNDENYLIVKV